ncbi:MAG: class I SAM-dependent methyltransferase [Eubacteriales bacterium]|nr:class I SAM-dependent methyltransferase [Eubacteriales bacterium]
MESYKDFSYLYDNLISKDVDYSQWADYLMTLFAKHNVKPALTLDLGCGTGTLTMEMAKRGCEMIGIDMSEDMLLIAQEKATENGLEIVYLNQDMSKFKLYGSVNAIVSSLDCINYLTTIKQLESLFKQVAFYLEPNGLFIFDVNSDYKMESVLGNNTFIYDEPDIFYVWKSNYNPKTQICNHHLTLFERDEDIYIRTDEYQRQRLFTYDEIKCAAEKSGLKIKGFYGDRKLKNPSKKCERFFYTIGK